MSKFKKRKNNMPIIIPNQPTGDLFFSDKQSEERKKEWKNQHKLSQCNVLPRR